MFFLNEPDKLDKLSLISLQLTSQGIPNGNIDRNINFSPIYSA